MAGLRPLLLSSRAQDEPQKIYFADGKWLRAAGGGGVAEVGDQAIYLALALRNVGNGIAVLHGWHFYPERLTTADHATVDDFTRLTRDLYVPAGDVGFWQGAFRDPAAPEFVAARDAIGSRPRVDDRDLQRRLAQILGS